MAEMRAGMRVWLPGPADQPFVPGACVAVEAGGQLKLKMDDGEEKSVDPSKVDVLAGNETGLTASDHCALINMNEPCVLENSRLRFLDDAIYTLVGTIMIAINPFARIDVYGPERMKLYAGKELGAHGVEAHLYGMGESAYRQMMRSQKQTALVMSGESGAGKTETARHLMNYIAWCSEQADASSAGQAGKLANMIIASSPLLEAFGNAKTVRNNNSSRFGKMMRLHFSPNGAMAGAYIKTYLLEKIRVVAITSPERSYHGARPRAEHRTSLFACACARPLPPPHRLRLSDPPASCDSRVQSSTSFWQHGRRRRSTRSSHRRRPPSCVARTNRLASPSTAWTMWRASRR